MKAESYDAALQRGPGSVDGIPEPGESAARPGGEERDRSAPGLPQRGPVQVNCDLSQSASRVPRLSAARSLGSVHHNIATDVSLTAVVLDPHFPGSSATELPQLGNFRHTSRLGYFHHSASRALIIAGLSGFFTLRRGP
jgi:hypothetical protein